MKHPVQISQPLVKGGCPGKSSSCRSERSSGNTAILCGHEPETPRGPRLRTIHVRFLTPCQTRRTGHRIACAAGDKARCYEAARTSALDASLRIAIAIAIVVTGKDAATVR